MWRGGGGGGLRHEVRRGGETAVNRRLTLTGPKVSSEFLHWPITVKGTVQKKNMFKLI